ncbi:hypothetical protein IE53DRAFT_20747 [Violaceomyces palustris]|uniref:Uncharacterized protein n=1 Tax=Violaceomyces palustris TaxID=1673888 RepID=A0ACD0P259_9BASI|nr:hypothetical protein IE53DRAFT_20747 [Violaceomyces palustris]
MQSLLGLFTLSGPGPLMHAYPLASSSFKLSILIHILWQRSPCGQPLKGVKAFTEIPTRDMDFLRQRFYFYLSFLAPTPPILSFPLSSLSFLILRRGGGGFKAQMTFPSCHSQFFQLIIVRPRPSPQDLPRPKSGKGARPFTFGPSHL